MGQSRIGHGLIFMVAHVPFSGMSSIEKGPWLTASIQPLFPVDINVPVGMVVSIYVPQGGVPIITRLVYLMNLHIHADPKPAVAPRHARTAPDCPRPYGKC